MDSSSVFLRFMVGMVVLATVCYDVSVSNLLFPSPTTTENRACANTLLSTSKHPHGPDVWVPERPGIYNWSSVPKEMSDALSLLFPAGELSPKARPVVAVVKRKAAGFAGRVGEGLSAIACLALLLGRPLAVDPDYLFLLEDVDVGDSIGHIKTAYGSGPFYDRMTTNADAERMQDDMFSVPMNETFVVSTSPIFKKFIESIQWESYNMSSAKVSAIHTFKEECYGDVYACGSMLLHASWGHFPVSHPKIDLLERIGTLHSGWTNAILPPNRTDYALLHMRVGGSNISVGGQNVPGLPHYDGYKTGLASAWLGEMRQLSSPEVSCETPLVINSDSSRFVGEASYLLWPSVQVATCCSSPIHIAFQGGSSSSSRTNHGVAGHGQMALAETQVLFDLVSMSRSSYYFSSIGTFGKLGHVFLQFRASGQVVTCSEVGCVTRTAQKLQDVLGCKKK